MVSVEKLKERIVTICGTGDIVSEYLNGVTDHAVWTDMSDNDIALDFRSFCEAYKN